MKNSLRPQRVVVIGLGWIGLELARAVASDPRFVLVGVADSDPKKEGARLDALGGTGLPKLRVESGAAELFKKTPADVAIVATATDPKKLQPTLSACVRHSVHAVTTCESLAALRPGDGLLPDSLDRAARKNGSVILATGINPGFAMDRLPLTLAQATRAVTRVSVLRVLDVGERRPQLQAKVGVGQSRAEFARAKAKREVGHAGLLASVSLIAMGLGFRIDRFEETLSPLFAQRRLSSALGPVHAGRVRGVRQTARGFSGKKLRIELRITLALKEPNPRDVIVIEGRPPLLFEGRFPGDTGTIATVISALPVLGRLEPGFRTVLDLPLLAQ